MTSSARLVSLGLLFLGARASASPGELVALGSQVGWGTSVAPERASLWTEGGWNGGDHRPQVDATVEAAVLPRASVFATAELGGVSSTARPAVGAALQLLDPRASMAGVRVTLAYKPEGFTEPEGELESTLVVTRPIGADAMRGRVAYGQDPEGRESDAEAGLSYVHRLAPDLTLGATARYRHAIKVKTTLEPRWDLIAGVSSGYVRGAYRVELLAGVDAIAFTPGPAQAGAVGLISVGVDL